MSSNRSRETVKAIAGPGEFQTRPGQLDVTRIYHEPAVPEYPRGREILDRFPAAERVVVPSHWNIPGLHGNSGAAEDWLRINRSRAVRRRDYPAPRELTRRTPSRGTREAGGCPSPNIFPSHWNISGLHGKRGRCRGLAADQQVSSRSTA